jgi:hypothetical protein
MKKIKNGAMMFGLIAITIFSTPSFGQVSPLDGLYQCQYYPTPHATLNTNISDLIAQNNEFERKMGSIYGNLSESEKQQVDVYIRNNDQALFTAFPQFNNEELKSNVTLLKEKYTTAVNTHKQAYPQFNDAQRGDAIREIIKCANSKAKVQQEGTWSGRMAMDDCEAERRNCIGSVAAGMHVACSAADLTIIAGIICHGAAFVYQWTAGNNCNIAARRCRETQQ